MRLHPWSVIGAGVGLFGYLALRALGVPAVQIGVTVGAVALLLVLVDVVVPACRRAWGRRRARRLMSDISPGYDPPGVCRRCGGRRPVAERGSDL